MARSSGGLLVLISGFATFRAKYAVQNIEDEANRVRKHTTAEQQEVRVLTAEWTYLNQPERLADLNRRFLGLTPIAAAQLQRRIEDIPLRPVVAPPPEPVPETTEAAAGEPEDAAPAVAPDAPALAALVQAVAAAPSAPVVSAQLPPPLPSTAASPITTASAATVPATAVRAATTPVAATPAPPVVQAVLRATSAPAPRVQLAKAVTPAHRGPGSLDALVAQIAEAR